MSRQDSIFHSAAFLAIIGILAGALGGLGIGLITQRSATAAKTTTAK
jgi:hypothetical protein